MLGERIKRLFLKLNGDLRILGGKRVLEELTRASIVAQGRLEEREDAKDRQLVLASGPNGMGQMPTASASRRAVADEDSGGAPAEAIEQAAVAEIAAPAVEPRAADLVDVIHRIEDLDAIGESRVRPTHARREILRRPRLLKREDATLLIRHDRVDVAVENQQRNASSVKKAGAEEAGGASRRRGGTHPRIAQRRMKRREKRRHAAE